MRNEAQDRSMKTVQSRTAEQNANSKKWRIVVKYSDGSMRRLPGAFKTQAEAAAAIASGVSK